LFLVCSTQCPHSFIKENVCQIEEAVNGLYNLSTKIKRVAEQ
jgi:hypothetical protein